jgi:heme/copper-type cytochrome/quinol oxidase subunit 3
MTTIPWTFTPRRDTRVSNIRLGVWLFLASEAMLFGSLFSAYVLLRTGAEQWADPRAVLSVWDMVPLTIVLALATWCAGRRAAISACAGVIFLAAKLLDNVHLLGAGYAPAVNLMLACWYVLTGFHWLHVAGGVVAGAWIATTAGRVPDAHRRERVHALRLYWLFVDFVWVAILICFFFS